MTKHILDSEKDTSVLGEKGQSHECYCSCGQVFTIHVDSNNPGVAALRARGDLDWHITEERLKTKI